MNSTNNTDRKIILKRLLVLLGAILLIFISINAVWFFGYRQRYNYIAKHLEATYIDDIEETDMLRYTKEVGDFTITMKMPAYLGGGGFVSIAKTEGYVTQLDDNGEIIAGSDMYITLYVWPKYFSDYKIGLDFYDEINSVWEQVELTSDMQIMNTDVLDSDYIQYVNELISEYDTEIAELVKIAEQTLELDIISD